MQDVQNSKISVEKIGGTSMTAFGDVLRHIMLYDRSRIYGRIYVVSAYSGVTNQLLEHKKTGERGIYALFAEGKGYQDALANLATSLKKLNAGYADLGLPLDVADAFVDQRIGQAREYLNAMHHVLATSAARMCCWQRAKCWHRLVNRTARSTRSRSSRPTASTLC